MKKMRSGKYYRVFREDGTLSYVAKYLGAENKQNVRMDVSSVYNNEANILQVNRDNSTNWEAFNINKYQFELLAEPSDYTDHLIDILLTLQMTPEIEDWLIELVKTKKEVD